MTEHTEVKFKSVMSDDRSSGFRKYRELVYGDMPLVKVLLAEFLTGLLGGLRGGFGLWIRSKLYPLLIAQVGRNVFFGVNVTLRHPHKIRLGDHVVIDDNCVIDAKGSDNRGITIEDNVYIGRNTIVYCKNGDIRLKCRVNVSSNCEIFSSNRLTVGEDTVIGAYSYLLSGGEYDLSDREHAFSEQTGMETKGELTVGPNCWLGTRVTVLDAACIGEHCVIGAGAVVNRPVPAESVAVGVPAKVVKSLA